MKRTPSVDEPARSGDAPRWRRALVAALVVLGCLLAPLSVLSVWMKTEILNSDNYVSTVAPLAHNADVQNAIANRVTNTLVVDNTVVNDVIGRLPPKADFLGPKISDALASFVHDGTLKVVQSDQFATLWKEANRRAHDQIVALLEAKGTQTLQTKNGQVVLELGPIAQKVNDAFEARGITAFANAAGKASNQQIVLVDSIWLKRSQNATNLLQSLAVLLPILTLLCFGVAFVLSPNRRRTILRSALGFAAGMAVLLIAFNGGRHFYLEVLPSSVNVKAASAVYDQVGNTLRLSLRTGFVLGLVVALGAFLAGPAKPAIRARQRRAPGARFGPGGWRCIAVGHVRGPPQERAAGARRRDRTCCSRRALGTDAARGNRHRRAVLIGIVLVEFLGRRAAPPAEPVA